MDDVLLNVGGVTVAGNVFINIGGGDQFVDAQNISLTGGFSAGRLAIVGSDSLGTNQVVTDDFTTIAGDVTVNFTGTTNSNTAVLLGSYGGTYGTFRGGTANDTLTFGASGDDISFVALMNEGDDMVSLLASTSLLSLVLDFGDGDDVFMDNLGMPYPFPVSIANLP